MGVKWNAFMAGVDIEHLFKRTLLLSSYPRSIVCELNDRQKNSL